MVRSESSGVAQTTLVLVGFEYRARKRVTIHGETPRDWSLLGLSETIWDWTQE